MSGQNGAPNLSGPDLSRSGPARPDPAPPSPARPTPPRPSRLQSARLRLDRFQLARFEFGWARVDRTALLRHLAARFGLRSYLEIGVRRRAANLDRIGIADRVGVDPDPRAGADHLMTSDRYFAEVCDRTFDLVFIDGLHTGDQVRRDVEHALARLAPGGFILAHDLNPPTAFHAREVYEVDGRRPAWNGACWQGFAALRRDRDDLEMMVVDADWGVGVIRRGRQTRLALPIETYDDLARGRAEILNLIPVEGFLARFPPRRPPRRRDTLLGAALRGLGLGGRTGGGQREGGRTGGDQTGGGKAAP